MTKLVNFTILLCCFCNINCLIFQTIGIYSICGENYTQNEFTKIAYAFDLVVSKAFELKITMVKHDFNNISSISTYKSFDICYDMEELLLLATKLLLDPEFYAVNKSIVLKGRIGASWEDKFHYYEIKSERSTMITRIITHIPQDLLQLFLDIMSFESIPISKDSSLIKSTTRMKERANFYNMEDSLDDIENYLSQRKWKDIIVIHTKSGDVFTPYFKRIVKMLSNMKGICMKTLTINDKNDSLRFIKNIEKEFNNSNKTKNFITITVGSGNYLYVNKIASYFENIHVILPFIGREYFMPFKWKTLISNTLRHAVEYQALSHNKRDDVFQRFENHTGFTTIQNNKATFIALLYSLGVSIPDKRWENAPRSCSTVTGSCQLYRWPDLVTAYCYLLIQSFSVSNYAVFHDRIPSHIESKCYQPICRPGYEKVFGKLPNESTPWDEEIGFYCRPCERNHVKPSYGDDHCQTCIEYFVSNLQRTKCIDPLLPVYHKPGDLSGIITCAISSIGGILCLFTVAMFIKHRAKPIVMSSDLAMSLIHLTAILLFFCITALYFTPPTSEMCMGRTLSIALLYNLNISIINIKSNKLVKAFSSKIRSTRFEVLKTTLMQFFSIFMNLLSASLLVVALWSYNYPGISVRLHIKNSKKFLYCSNGNDNIVLCGIMLFLQMACFVQAFRCRKLPGHISEAMSIVYALFIVTVSLCVMFPIYFFQKYEETGELVLVLVLSGNNLILFLFMYAKKLFVIIFMPEKNTKEYFRRKQMESIQAKAKKM